MYFQRTRYNLPWLTWDHIIRCWDLRIWRKFRMGVHQPKRNEQISNFLTARVMALYNIGFEIHSRALLLTLLLRICGEWEGIPTTTAWDTVVPPTSQLQLSSPLFVIYRFNCTHTRILCHRTITYALSITYTEICYRPPIYVRKSWLHKIVTIIVTSGWRINPWFFSVYTYVKEGVSCMIFFSILISESHDVPILSIILVHTYVKESESCIKNISTPFWYGKFMTLINIFWMVGCARKYICDFLAKLKLASEL